MELSLETKGVRMRADTLPTLQGLITEDFEFHTNVLSCFIKFSPPHPDYFLESK
jgi:hypothetical protein